MENKDNELILSFDMLFTNNHIQILKLLLPYFESDAQKRVALLIKYLEFQYTLDYFKKNPNLPGAICIPAISSQANNGGPDIIEIFSRIRSFCTPSERALFDQLSSMKKNMERYEEIMSMMQMFSEFTDNSGNSHSSEQSEAAPMDFLKNMLTPEQQNMFDLFQSAFPT